MTFFVSPCPFFFDELSVGNIPMRNATKTNFKHRFIWNTFLNCTYWPTIWSFIWNRCFFQETDFLIVVLSGWHRWIFRDFFKNYFWWLDSCVRMAHGGRLVGALEGKQMGLSASTSPTSFLMWAPLQETLSQYSQQGDHINLELFIKLELLACACICWGM